MRKVEVEKYRVILGVVVDIKWSHFDIILSDAILHIVIRNDKNLESVFNKFRFS